MTVYIKVSFWRILQLQIVVSQEKYSPQERLEPFQYDTWK